MNFKTKFKSSHTRQSYKILDEQQTKVITNSLGGGEVQILFNSSMIPYADWELKGISSFK